MTPYERMIKCMRRQGAYENKKGLQYAEAVSAGQIRVGDAILDKDFFSVAAHVGDITKGDILICCQMEEDMYIVLGKVV